ncbi:pterin-4-alpha-carbinolamine dehydratase 2, mitochondrial isoform X1 [Phoenix dactylifera]|uniref:4a-hydroxytetrahydrobiopterin dehydratase n=1 Tax=Phoenix dactylifera TaxID=42345 RepID=A0A8B7CJU0_PHODC|nr:pterin-4-alpha-carbinolamine dehydratase 2, mitochondrial isoform X1 [Phoenix dactylifera]
MAMMNRVLHTRLLFLLKAPLASPLLSHGRSDCWISNMCQACVRVPPLRKFSDGFSCSSTSQDLTSKKCVPCDSKDIRPMSEQSANELLAQVQGWNLLSEGGVMKLHRSCKVKSFTKGLEFFQLVADVAEAEGHHPDLHLVGWNNVKIDIWTHSVGGLTENDFILAAKINSLHVEHLLRRKAVA